MWTATAVIKHWMLIFEYHRCYNTQGIADELNTALAINAYIYIC